MCCSVQVLAVTAVYNDQSAEKVRPDRRLIHVLQQRRHHER